MAQGFTQNWEAIKAWLISQFGDHGNLNGLSDDDHTQYLNRSGVRPMQGTLNLDDNEIDNVDGIQFGLTPASGHVEGLLHYSPDDLTLEVGVGTGGVELQIGQENLVLVKNQTGSDISDGSVVSYDGAVGASGRIKVKLAIADGTDPAMEIFGVATETILNGADGFVTTWGKVRGLDTTGTPVSETWNDGDILYVSPTTAGTLTKTPPSSPDQLIPMAVVVYSHAVTGVLFVRVTPLDLNDTGGGGASVLADLTDVDLYAPSDGQVLTYDAYTGLWQNEDVGGIRELLTSGRSYYVATTGSDSNDGLTPGTPFLTIQKAYNVIVDTLDLAGYTVTISVANGTYGGVDLTDSWVGGGRIHFVGDTTTPSNVQMSSATPFRVRTSLPNVLQVKGFDLNGTVYGLEHIGEGTVEFGYLLFSGTGCTAHIKASGINAILDLDALTSLEVSSDATYMFFLDEGSSLTTLLNTITASGGTRTFTTIARFDNLAYGSFDSHTFAGTWSGKKYDVTHNAVLYADGTGIAGDSAGTIDTGGTYNDEHDSGASALADLTDVDLYAPSDGQVLTYDAYTGLWQNEDPTGSGDATSIVIGETPGGSINGSNTAFTTAGSFIAGSLEVYLNGQRLTSGTDYTEGSSAFTMTIAPLTGDILRVNYLGTYDILATGVSSFVVNETPSGTVDGSNAIFTCANAYVAGSILVFRDGQLMKGGGNDYTETTPGSGIFTFTTAPASGSVILVTYQQSITAAGNADTLDGYHASSFQLVDDNAYKIIPSVSSGLIVSLKLSDGTSNPSTSNPLYFNINGVQRKITSQLQLTLADGTNWFEIGDTRFATYEQDLFVYIGYNAIDGVTLGVSRIPYAKKYGDFSTTSTNEKYAGISDISNATSDDPYQVIGRLAATLSGGAGYTWSIPTYTPLNLVQYPIYDTRKISFLPSGTVITTGNGTWSGWYAWRGNNVVGQIKFVFGSTSAMGSGVPVLTLPFDVSSDYINSPSTMNVQLQDTGSTVDIGVSYLSTGDASIFCIYTGGVYFTRSALSSTQPFTWANTDIITVDLDYRG